MSTDFEKITDVIDAKVGEVRFGGIDISFGELLSLHKNRELIIDPDYQRLFRWSPDQQSRLVESILLGLPIPQIFVVENADGTLELIDGLQRISSVMNFLEPEELPEDVRTSSAAQEGSPDRLRLEGCDIVKELNGATAESLPLTLRLGIKRASVRMIVVKRQSNPALRYQMFKRLNTGGSDLSEQEVRNCTARIIGPKGIEFNRFLIECAATENFLKCIESLSESERDQKQDEELVLRFFALKNMPTLFKGNVSDFLTKASPI